MTAYPAATSPTMAAERPVTGMNAALSAAPATNVMLNIMS